MGKPVWSMVVIATALGQPIGCGARRTASDGSTKTPVAVHGWQIYDGETLILEVWDTPGPLMSTAAPPPDFQVSDHPFFSATAHSADHESRLRELLKNSTSVTEYLDRLRTAGFTVRPIKGP